MTLAHRVRLLASLLSAAAIAAMLAAALHQARRQSQADAERRLDEARGTVEAFLQARLAALRPGVRVLANDPAFKAGMTVDAVTVFDMLKEKGQDIEADCLIATGPSGIVIARTDRPGAPSENLSKDPLVMRSLAGEETSAVWRQRDELFHAIALPMRFGQDLVGVLIAGYRLDAALAARLQELTHSQVTVLPRSKGGGAGDHLALEVPLRSADGEVVGGLLVRVSMAEEGGALSRSRRLLVLVSGAVLALALAIAYVGARRITALEG